MKNHVKFLEKGDFQGIRCTKVFERGAVSKSFVHLIP
jgi:hypothetical protein